MAPSVWASHVTSLSDRHLMYLRTARLMRFGIVSAFLSFLLAAGYFVLSSTAGIVRGSAASTSMPSYLRREKVGVPLWQTFFEATP